VTPRTPGARGLPALSAGPLPPPPARHRARGWVLRSLPAARWQRARLKAARPARETLGSARRAARGPARLHPARGQHVCRGLRSPLSAKPPGGGSRRRRGEGEALPQGGRVREPPNGGRGQGGRSPPRTHTLGRSNGGVSRGSRAALAGGSLIAPPEGRRPERGGPGSTPSRRARVFRSLLLVYGGPGAEKAFVNQWFTPAVGGPTVPFFR